MKRTYKTTNQKQVCTPGWPKATPGYPLCETTPSQSQANLVNSPVTPNLFTYCSPPSPVLMADVSGIQRRNNYRNNVPQPRGVHSYYNVMWDGRVRRGDPRKKSALKEAEECQKILNRLNQPRKGKTFAELKAEAKAITDQPMLPTSTVQTELLRFSQLGIANLCPKDPEKYLQDLHDEIDIEDPCYKGKRLQTLRNFPIAPSKKPNLLERGTQVFPGDFFDFEGEAQPVIEMLIGAVVEQARLEILEEEELAALILQKQQHEAVRVKGLADIEKWKGREGRVEEERLRLKREEALGKSGLTKTQKMYQACAVGGNLTKDAIDECVENLRREAELAEERDEDESVHQDGIISWINDEVLKELKEHEISRNFLDGVIIDVVNKREAQYAEAIWREVYEEDPLRKYGKHDGFVPPTPETSLAEEQSEEEWIGTSDYFNQDSDEY